PIYREPRDRPLEPAVLEGQRLGGGLLEADTAGNAPARLVEHLRGRVDGPDLGRSPLGERGGEPARARADVDHAAAAQIALADEELEQLPPVGVGRAKLVVDRS